MKSSRGGRGLILLVAFGGLSLAGCQKDGEMARELVKARQAEWSSDLGALGHQQAELRARFGELPRLAPGSDLAESNARRQAAAVLDGNRQSLLDVQIQMHQAGARVEQAATRGDEAGRQAVDDESARIATYLQTLRGQLAATEGEVATLRWEVGHTKGTEKDKAPGMGASAARAANN